MPEFKITAEFKKNIPWKLAVIFLCFSAAIILLGISFYKSQKNRIFFENQNYLTAVASLKIGQIQQWHRERLGDATSIRDNEPLISCIKQYFRDINNTELKTILTKWMNSICTEYDYSDVVLVDTALKVRLSLTSADTVAGEIIRNELVDVMIHHKIIMTDLHKSDSVGYVYFDLLIPLIDPESKNRFLTGILILRIDPSILLFPLIQSWPTPSKSSETLILRRDRDSVLYLNELRYQKKSALNLRLPLTNNSLLASKATMGQKGVVEGVDYRNIPVVGYLSEVPGFPWFMVAKVDKEEILAPLKRYVILIVIVIVLLVLINAFVSGFWFWNQRVKMYRLRLKDESALRESEDKFKYIFDHSVIGKSITLPSGEINVNNAFCDMLGYSSEELVKRKWQEVSHPDDIEMTQKNLDLLLSGEKNSLRFVKRYIHKNGSVVWTDVGTTLRRDENGKALYFMTAVNNITDRKNAESQIKRLNEELEERVILRTEQLQTANKELEAFSYSVSHDLRAPLRSVHGFTKILLEDYEANLDEEGKRICKIISSSASQMGELIDDLLSFSKIGRSSLNSSELDMKKMVRLAFEGMTSPSERIKIKLKIGNLHQVFGDVALLSQVWINLLSNAIKYSSKNEFSEISVGSTESGGMITYYVKDKGVGFDMQYVHKLFGVFQRLHSEVEFEGNGVGLAIVQRIILKHGGKVWAEGETGKGATFYFSLPIESNRQTINQTPDTRRLTSDARNY